MLSIAGVVLTDLLCYGMVMPDDPPASTLAHALEAGASPVVLKAPCC
jgi:hypothetical protein